MGQPIRIEIIFSRPVTRSEKARIETLGKCFIGSFACHYVAGTVEILIEY